MAEAITKNSTKQPPKWGPFGWFVAVHFGLEPTQISIYRVSYHAGDNEIGGKCIVSSLMAEMNTTNPQDMGIVEADWIEFLVFILALYRAGHILATIEVGKIWLVFIYGWNEDQKLNQTAVEWRPFDRVADIQLCFRPTQISI